MPLQAVQYLPETKLTPIYRFAGDQAKAPVVPLDPKYYKITHTHTNISPAFHLSSESYT